MAAILDVKRLELGAGESANPCHVRSTVRHFTSVGRRRRFACAGSLDEAALGRGPPMGHMRRLPLDLHIRCKAPIQGSPAE
jgi:hypothetical protein